ncbi:MAG: ribonuclease H-like domain-containing protein [Clostridiales bacterium]|nr:ribonuclease H-like domain-containing protein [Clostridiales bacterium]
MIHRLKSFPIRTLPLFQQHFLTESMLLFDIETTGLSAARDHIYCIGCGYRTGDEIITELFFAEEPAQEKDILTAFFALLENRSTVVTFNGNAFDIPFVRRRAALYEGLSAGEYPDLAEASDQTASPGPGCAASVSALTFIDLYREAIRMKALLRLPSWRQKSIEQFLGCTREDRYDGGQLIRIYHRYESDPDSEALSVLLLHNEEDVRGMFDLIGLLSWCQLRDGAFVITESFEETDGESSFYNIKICPKLPFPRSIGIIDISPDLSAAQPTRVSSGYGWFRLGKETGLLRLPIQHGTLKHFYSDPENYVYLPEEDCAVHKSIGAFVDSSHRRKATRQNCYSRQECHYITLPVKTADGFLRKEFRDNCSYLALPAEEKDVRQLILRLFSVFL